MGKEEADPLPTLEELQRDFPQYQILAMLGRAAWASFTTRMVRTRRATGSATPALQAEAVWAIGRA